MRARIGIEKVKYCGVGNVTQKYNIYVKQIQKNLDKKLDINLEISRWIYFIYPHECLLRFSMEALSNYVSLCTCHITLKSFSCHGAMKPGFMKRLTHGKERSLSHDDTGNTNNNFNKLKKQAIH